LLACSWLGLSARYRSFTFIKVSRYGTLRVP
jgi:hypothetical protein